MKAEITITKSFDEGRAFTKVWEHGDLRKFFDEEGGYMDSLSNLLLEHGKEGENFTMTYKVTVTK